MGDSGNFMSNPVYASKCGQEALQDLLSALRDLMLPFYTCMDPKNRGLHSSHQAFIAAPQCLEAMNQIKNKRMVLQQAFQMVRESCERLVPKDTSDIIPYVDSSVSTNELKSKLEAEDKPELKSLIDAREQAKNRLLDAVKELEKLRRTLTTTLWELNDLSQHPLQSPDGS